MLYLGPRIIGSDCRTFNEFSGSQIGVTFLETYIFDSNFILNYTGMLYTKCTRQFGVIADDMQTLLKPTHSEKRILSLRRRSKPHPWDDW